MKHAHVCQSNHAAEIATDQHYLATGLLRIVSLLLVVVAWGWGVALFAIGRPLIWSPEWLAPLTLAAFAIASYRLASRNSLAAGICLQAAVWFALTFSAWLSRSPLYFLGYPFVLILAGVTARSALLATATVITLGSVAWLRLPWGVPNHLCLATWLALLAGVGFGSLLHQHVLTALEWSQSSRERATREMLKARARQGEVARAYRALDEEYERMQHLNQELAAARREAEEARRIKAEFAANVSHELRTPLNLVVGFSELMYSSPECYGGQLLPPEYLRDIHATYRSAKHLQSLVDDILDLSQIDAHRMGMTREIVAMPEIVHEACETVRQLVERRGLSLIVDAESNMPPIYADRTRLRQVLLNLVSNAIRFTEEGTITVRCFLHNSTLGSTSGKADTGRPSLLSSPSSLGRYLMVSVSDTGIGIEPRDISKLFEAFRQADGSTRRRFGGTGLGLAVSKRLIELHDGWIWAEGEPGQGSTFTFALPTSDQVWSRPRVASRTGEPRDSVHPRTLLVIDDDPQVTSAFDRYVHRHRVVTACSTKEALELAMRVHPDIVVAGSETYTDFHAAAACARGLASARLTVMSCAMPSERRKGLSLGMNDYLLKPVNREALWQALDRVVPAVQQILIIEDEPSMMRLLERMLKADSPELSVIRAYTAEEGISILERNRPDVILLDLMLPGLSGKQFLEWLRRPGALQSLPVIGVSATASLLLEEDWRVTHLQLERGSGFASHEVIDFAVLASERFPSSYYTKEDSLSKGTP